MFVSPFSLSHDWSLEWTRVPSHIKPFKFINGESPKERKALEALASVGIIGGLQLSRLFSLDKNQKRKMVREKKLVRHELKKNNRSIPVYTLGINGAVIAGLPKYDANYWVEYKVEDVLKRLLFFQLYEHFPNAKILPAMDPFIGMIFYKKKPIYIYVVRGHSADLKLFLKWESLSDRVIVVTENLNHLDLIKPFIENLKLRVTTDEELWKGVLQSMFYFQSEFGLWKKEGEEKRSKELRTRVPC